ncbi:MAG: putative oxidoreductase, partial [Candidatus Marinamargulisbacteria bacterium]
ESLSANVLFALAVIELFIIIGFLLGYKKRLTYGAVLILHGISTFSSYNQYLSPFDKGNLLFFAAWPMLAACVALYLLKDLDNLYTVSR